MTTTALVLTVLVSLVGMGFLVRWEIRRQERRRNAAVTPRHSTKPASA